MSAPRAHGLRPASPERDFRCGLHARRPQRRRRHRLRQRGARSRRRSVALHRRRRFGHRRTPRFRNDGDEPSPYGKAGPERGRGYRRRSRSGISHRHRARWNPCGRRLDHDRGRGRARMARGHGLRRFWNTVGSHGTLGTSAAPLGPRRRNARGRDRRHSRDARRGGHRASGLAHHTRRRGTWAAPRASRVSRRARNPIAHRAPRDSRQLAVL